MVLFVAAPLACPPWVTPALSDVFHAVEAAIQPRHVLETLRRQVQTSRTRRPPAPMSKRLGTLQIKERGEWANSDEQKPLAAMALPLFRAVAR